MFVENYRLDMMIGGQAQTAIPYPKISDEDWQAWKAFLPVKSVLLYKKVLLHNSKNFLYTAYGIPPDACHEIVRGAGHFEEIEVWGKRQIRKDPHCRGPYWKRRANVFIGDPLIRWLHKGCANFLNELVGSDFCDLLLKQTDASETKQL